MGRLPGDGGTSRRPYIRLKSALVENHVAESGIRIAIDIKPDRPIQPWDNILPNLFSFQSSASLVSDITRVCRMAHLSEAIFKYLFELRRYEKYFLPNSGNRKVNNW